MSFPPLHPSVQNSAPSSDSQSSNPGSTRPRQSAWGLPAQTSSRRGLTPLSTTNVSSEIGAQTGSSTNNTSASTFAPSFSSVLNSSSRFGNTRSSSSTALNSPSLLSSLQTGSQLPASQQLSSPRSRTNTPFSTSNLASSVAGSTTASQGGGGGSSGGGGSRPTTFSPSPATQNVTSPTTSSFDRNPFNSTPTSANQSSVAKIIIAQVSLLLGSITEKEGKSKWDTQAEAIRKLVYSNGMEVHGKYFRRLLLGNAPRIFPEINRSVENPGNYPLLVEEVQRASRDSQQARRIAETIDTADDQIFRDFDLARFITHFKLDPIGQTILAASFTQVSKQDLRVKASGFLASIFKPLLQSFAGPESFEQDIPAVDIATSTFLVLLHFPESARDGSEKDQVFMAIESRYMSLNQHIPNVTRSAMALLDIMEREAERGNDLLHQLMRQGPTATASPESSKDFLRRCAKPTTDAAVVGSLLLFTVCTPDAEQYSPTNLVQAIRDVFQSRISWQEVISTFDREGLAVTQTQLLSLYQALVPIAEEDPDFDIQLLWGGKWHNKATQLSFAVSFASLTGDQLNATRIPRLRLAYDPREWKDLPAEYADFADLAVKDPMISLDAVTAIIEGLWDPTNALPQDIEYAKQIVGEKLTYFLSSAGGIPKPWVPSHQALMTRNAISCLVMEQKDYRWLLHCMWKEDKQWLAGRLMELHSEDPLRLPILLEHARTHGWLEELCTMTTGFGLDLAALAHRESLINFNDWANDKLERNAEDFINALSRFLMIKAQDESRTQRHEQSVPRTVSLAMKTVYAMLEVIEAHLKEERDQIRTLERNCMQGFPRLCNYGEGHDEVIEANGADGNTLPPTADLEMQDLYKRMYGQELEVRDVIEVLKECKSSNQPDRQELFACMIHGLFDEYICFREYPLGPLATTAVLFGGIIHYRLLNNFALNVALEMVLEAARDVPDKQMYKFGLQALLHFQGRFPEWPEFSQQIVQIPGLQGTQVYKAAQDALRDPRNGTQEPNGINNGDTPGSVNGDDLDASESLVPQFRSVNVDPHPGSDRFEDPSEAVQDKVLFVLNNVSEQNLSTKIHDLMDSLEPKHYQWFASYLVEQRAKSQPNYQQLYLELLSLLGDRDLWTDVLRETYASVRKVLNAESTMKNSIDRTHLKNLGVWLGSLTLARDKPIKHKNIAFKELLIEGYETQRLILTIPFTCEVLAQGAKSVVFKPPNPWVMEVISVLMELYDLPELKVQQKFAVEILLNVFGLPRNGEGIARSTELVKRRLRFESEMAESGITDGIEGFEDLSMSRPVRNARFSPTAIAATLPDLTDMLVFPPSSGPNSARVKQIVIMAVQRSIMEIIGPVVERSVTIATIATKDLVTKDYSLEGDEDRLREALENVAKTTSGSLASVTCKEPLRMSITNHIRNALQEMPDLQFPEGAVLMSVNDNLDIACKIVERQAEERALPEIKAHIEAEVTKRQEHKANIPNEPYRDAAAFSQWATYIGEPWKLQPGGLNQQQLDIYENFGPQARGIVNHQQNVSTDSGKQIPDVLQESGYNVPSLSTPAEPPAVPHQPQPQQPHSNLPLALSGIRSPAQVNGGYVDPAAVEEQAYQILTEMARLTKETPDQRFKNQGRESPVIELFGRLLSILRQAPDIEQLAIHIASGTTTVLYQSAESRYEIETFSQILLKMCQASAQTYMTLTGTLRKSIDTRILRSAVTAALLEVQLLEFPIVDMALRRGLEGRSVETLHAFGELLDLVLFTKEPIALRADFATSFQAMSEWLALSPELDEAQAILHKMKVAGIQEPIEAALDTPSKVAEEQMRYTFTEWVTLYQHTHSTEHLLVGFIAGAFQTKIIKNQEDLILFLRLAIDAAVTKFEQEWELSMKQQTEFNVKNAHFQIDALARFIVLLVKNQGEIEPSATRTKAQFLESILNLVILVLNYHHVERGDRFNVKSWFRLFSSILYDWHELGRATLMGREDGVQQDEEMVRAFANTFLLLEPQYFPGFAYGWLNLISHRVFLLAILGNGGLEGSELYVKLLQDMLSYVCSLLKSHNNGIAATNLYRGVLRIVLVLHHDFPEFLAQNHHQLCSVIPPQHTQLCNLVLSAFPTSMFDLPDPFTTGLKVDRLEDIRKAPELDGDFMIPLRQTGLEELLKKALQNFSDSSISQLIEALETIHEKSSLELDSSPLQSLVIYIGQSAVEDGTNAKNATPFNVSGSHAVVLKKLTRELSPEIRYCLLSAIINQLRYPNSHTHFFSHGLLHLFGTDQSDIQGTDIRQQITRVLLERIVVHRPHPWGLIITLLELLKNPAYMFWDLPFTKAVPEIETLFSTLFRVNNSPGPLA